MAMIDKVKAQIDFLKFLVGFMLTTLLGVSGWAITQATTLNGLLFAVTLFFLTSLVVLSIIVLIVINHKINELEEL